MKDSIIIIIAIVIIMLGTIYISFTWGYSQRANDINIRITQFPNNQEECFTREEVDNFIYGE